MWLPLPQLVCRTHLAFWQKRGVIFWNIIDFLSKGVVLQELEEGDVSASSTAVAICKQGLAEAIMAERPRWRRQEDAAEAENLLREALATFQQAPMEPSLIADLHVRQLTAPIYRSQHHIVRRSRTLQNAQIFSLEMLFHHHQ